MSDDGLPETSDPFELLGVSPDADERTLKRAYATLIKRYRPERAPEEFKRIRAAYDEAVAMGQCRAIAAALDADSGLDDLDEPPGDERDDDEPAGIGVDGRAVPPAIRAMVDDDWQAIDEADRGPVDALLQRIDALLGADQIDALLTRLFEPDALSAALRYPEVRTAVARALAGAMWTHYRPVMHLYTQLGGASGDWHHELFDEMRALYPHWHAATQTRQCPDALSRVMRLGRSLADEEARRQARALAADMEAEPRAYLRFFGAMARQGAGLFHHYQLAMHAYRHTAEVAIEDHPSATQAAAARGLRAAGRATIRRWEMVAGYLLPLVLLVGAPAAVLAALYGGAGMGAVALIVVLPRVRRWSKSESYFNGPLPVLFRLALAHGIGPGPLYRWMGNQQVPCGWLKALKMNWSGDVAIHSAAIAWAAIRQPDEIERSYGEVIPNAAPVPVPYQPGARTPAWESPPLTREEQRAQIQREAERRAANTRRDKIIVGAILAGLILLYGLFYFLGPGA